MDNVQKSEIIIAKILSKLIENGIQRSEMNAALLSLSDDEKPFFAECFKWLANEEIVRADNVIEFNDGSLDVINPQITSDGFKMLGRQLEINGNSKSLESAVQEISRDGQSFSQIGDLVGGILGGFAKSVSS